MGIAAGKVREDRSASAAERQAGEERRAEEGRRTRLDLGSSRRRYREADRRRGDRRNFSTSMRHVAGGHQPRRTRHKFRPSYVDGVHTYSSSESRRRELEDERAYQVVSDGDAARRRVWRESRGESSSRDESDRVAVTEHRPRHRRSGDRDRETAKDHPRHRRSGRDGSGCAGEGHDGRRKLRDYDCTERTGGKSSSSGSRKGHGKSEEEEEVGETEGRTDRRGHGKRYRLTASGCECGDEVLPRGRSGAKGNLSAHEDDDGKAPFCEAGGRNIAQTSTSSQEPVRAGEQAIDGQADDDGYGGSNMAFLPQDVLMKIFGALSYRDVRAASAVCRGWRSAAAPIREGVLFHKWGKRFRHGRGGVKKNQEKALDCFLKGAARGSAAAMVDAGLMLWERDRKEEAVGWYRRAAESGDAVGQCNYGLALQAGESGEARQEEAVKWFQKSALAGNSRARYSLALCLQHGRGIKKDPSQAVRWYLLIAASGKQSAVKAMYNVALCYQVGEGVQRNKREAEKWMMKAAFAGHSRAQLCYAEQMKDHDPVRSFIFYELAARGGEASAAVQRDDLAQQLPQSWVQRAFQAANDFKVQRDDGLVTPHAERSSSRRQH
ncbi:hypothetical protein CBR_g41529 [Chara braunii]|uniref:F-box domain-containing protein n=1 Tax=Chara braunii TaxID=69332 RepID=A0A388K2Q4_CHABU|nr:hypothetical protein CBR_g41529 [Chara braunii]|eukprot:GBG64328.1 hypothetical protein CBR_g41529 [Chara braunii]